MDKLLLDIWPEVANLLSVSRKTAYDLANSKGFPTVRIGRRKLVCKAGLEQWIQERRGVNNG